MQLFLTFRGFGILSALPIHVGKPGIYTYISVAGRKTEQTKPPQVLRDYRRPCLYSLRRYMCHFSRLTSPEHQHANRWLLLWGYGHSSENPGPSTTSVLLSKVKFCSVYPWILYPSRLPRKLPSFGGDFTEPPDSEHISFTSDTRNTPQSFIR